MATLKSSRPSDTRNLNTSQYNYGLEMEQSPALARYPPVDDFYSRHNVPILALAGLAGFVGALWFLSRSPEPLPLERPVPFSSSVEQLNENYHSGSPTIDSQFEKNH